MFSFLKKKKVPPSFSIDFPQITLSPDTDTLIASLKSSAIEYTLVTDGYIIFAGRTFGCDIPLMFGIHFNVQNIEFIEIFRPQEYYQSASYDIYQSFAQLSGILRMRYGKPLVTTAASMGGPPGERWYTSDYIVTHDIIDRFGPEEHLQIHFYKK